MFDFLCTIVLTAYLISVTLVTSIFNQCVIIVTPYLIIVILVAINACDILSNLLVMFYHLRNVSFCMTVLLDVTQ